MNLRKLFPTFRNVGRFFRSNVTRSGRAMLFLFLFCSIGLIYLETPLVFLFTAIASILTLSAVFSFFYRPNLKCQAVAPEIVQANEMVTADLILKNRRVRNAYEVFIELENSMDWFQVESAREIVVDAIPAGEIARESFRFKVCQRGVYPLPSLSVGSSFPFNIFCFRQTAKFSEKLIVTPPYLPLKEFSLPQSQNSADVENERNLQFAHSAGNSEYVGNREYVEGLPVRRWDFSSWARTGKPTVREFRENQRGNTMLWIDTFWAGKGKKSEERFELFLSLAMSIAQRLSEEQVDLNTVVLGNQIFHIGSGLPNEQLTQVGRILAEANRLPPGDFSQTVNDQFLSEATRNNTISIMLLNQFDPQRRQLVDQIESMTPRTLALQTATKPASVRDEISTVTWKAIESGKVAIR